MQRRSEAASITGTYVVCLACGKEFAYDWEAMKVINDKASRTQGRMAAVPSRKAA
jgi:hypothetical protein